MHFIAQGREHALPKQPATMHAFNQRIWVFFTREDTSFIAWLGLSKTQIVKVPAQEAGVHNIQSQLKPHKAFGQDKKSKQSP